MDVLVYSALNEQAALKKEVAEKQACLFDLKADSAAGGGSDSDAVAGDCAKAYMDPTSSNFEKKIWNCKIQMVLRKYRIILNIIYYQRRR